MHFKLSKLAFTTRCITTSPETERFLRNQRKLFNTNAIALNRVTLDKGKTGLGITIAGGTDSCYFDNDPGVYVSKIIEGGAAARDKRLHVNDRIMRVDQQPLENVSHEEAVKILTSTGSRVVLEVDQSLHLAQKYPDQLDQCSILTEEARLVGLHDAKQVLLQEK